ncbi:MAG: hypothetical protein KGI27_13960 [Thaumarchaeota archaeon]|nr:hypothetical protein [Nitrososphaerota archaeon]
MKPKVYPLVKSIFDMSNIPTAMRIITNLMAPDNMHKDTWFPQGGIIAITTSQPDQTEFLDMELFDGDNNLIEVDQIDPEFEQNHPILLRRIKVGWENLHGEKCKLRLAWADSSGEEYSEEQYFQCD